MKKPKTVGFFAFMGSIGILVIGGIGAGFYSSAPSLKPTAAHREARAPQDCLNCHVHGTQNNPIMPHRPMEYCGFCHTAAK